MFGDRNSNLLVDLGRPGFVPSLLFRIYQTAYRYVLPIEDLTHEGVYQAGSRDHAERGREAVVTAILNAKGEEAWAIKLKMADDPLNARFRDRLALLAREKAAEEVDSVALSEQEVKRLDRYGEASPSTRDAMFEVLVDRLDDLDDLLLQDTSPRAAWALVRDETIMRRLIARELTAAANQIYTVDQESATADEKETDIRLRAPSGQQGIIELKIGENWSGRVLRDTINDQLVTKYMASESCRSGCLLVTVATDRGWEHPGTGETLDIQGLLAMLSAEASRIASKLGDSLRIAVKVLDLRPRLSSSSN